MVKLVNRAKMNTATQGTGTITLGDAVDSYQSFSSAGVQNGDEVRYVIEDGAEWEIGTGIFSNNTLTRVVSESSNNGNALNLSGNAQVFVTATSDDFGAKYYEATIPSSAWVVDEPNPYTAEITVNGIKADDRPYVSLDFSKIIHNLDINSKINEYNFIYRVDCISNDILKFYSQIPLTKNINVLIKVV